METNQPERLPITVDQCRTLAEWRNLVKGQSQREVALQARVKQARISEVETGKVMPRRKYWPGLMTAYGLTGEDAPVHFYRMIQNAHLLRIQKLHMQKPMAETHPLLASGTAVRPAEFLKIGTTNPHAPAGSITRAQA